jgi:flavin reductase (DIM6/NTAB) family NADH-FMN oxidoreductase RutF
LSKRRGLRAAFGRFPTGVAVMTTIDESCKPIGLTVNSFVSLSLDPPMALWCLRRSSALLDVFTRSDHFLVNVLNVQQQHLAIRFAQAAPEDRFVPGMWHRHPSKLPVLAGSVAVLLCKMTRTVDGGDHVIILGQVEDHRVAEGAPLLFVDGRYRRL